ncbi:MAG: hypothetical protein D6706_04410 [Chloroflexi bacterium]|nr:MAG: hypothetical protein D6706_04410 [Chloroflexota bacterium]
MKRFAWALALPLALTLLTGFCAWAGTSNLVHKPSYVSDEVLVTPSIGLSFAAYRIRTSGMHILQVHKGATPFLRIKLKPGQSVTGAMRSLASQTWVAKVQPNYIYHSTALPNDPRFSEQWGMRNTGQVVNGWPAGTAGADASLPGAWDENTNCVGITVAVIDTGVDYNHPELSNQIWLNAGEIPNNGIDDDGNGYVDDVRGWDFVQNDNAPMDFNEHGTHVAGIIGAAGNNATGVVGACWRARIMPLRVLNSVGSGTTADIVAAIDYARLNGAKIINMSLGGPGGSPGDLMDTAIANANAAGILVVAAAGNDGSNNDVIPQYPASYTQPNIIAVAATDQNDALATFSNYGATSVDIGAPGMNILSSVPPARTPVCNWNFDVGTMQGWVGKTWNITNVLNPLKIANSVNITTETSSSPLYSLTDTPGLPYRNNRSYRAISPACNLTGVQGAQLNFDLNLSTDVNDLVYMEASKDALTWTNLLGPNIGMSGSTFGLWLNSSLLGVDGDLGFLDGLAAGYVRFRLDTDATVVADGFHIDNVKITAANTGVAAHKGNEYAFIDGTSMAAPLVAGVAALVWAADPTLTHLKLRTRLLNNGDPVAALTGKTVSGRRINAQMAMPLHAATALSATVNSATRVDLIWTDNSVSEQNYLVQRNSGARFVTIATLRANRTAYSDTVAPSNTTISYRVVAKARDGRMIKSSTVTVTTPAAPPPPASGGGGCVMASSGRFDPLLPGLAMVGLFWACWRRRHSKAV